MRRNGRAFTLVELLIVIGIIALLLAIIVPRLFDAKELARQATCQSNLEHIGQAVAAYTNLFGQHLHPAPNNGIWERPLGTPLTAEQGYWGIAYVPYLDGSRGFFDCPSAQATDCDPGMWSNWPDIKACAYGWNAFWGGATRTPDAAIFHMRDPAATIAAHDSHEHLIESSNDTLSDWGTGINISQWRNCTRGSCPYPDKNHEREYYRHLGNSSVLWFDGHVSAIRESLGDDVPSIWYTGVDIRK